MPQTIGFWHFASGANLRLALYPLNGGASLSESSGVPLTESNATETPGFYTADVDDELTGLFRARISQNDAIIYDGTVHLPAETSPAVVDAQIPVEAEVASFQQTALSQLAAKPVLTVAAPALQGDQLCPSIIRGDSYLAEHDRAIEFSRSDFPDLPAGCTVQLTAQMVNDESTRFSIAGEVVTATGTKVVRFQPTSQDTSSYVPGKYSFDVEVQFPDGNTATFFGPQAYLRVVADLTHS